MHIPLTTHHSLLQATYYLVPLLTTHRSPLTTHHLLLTPHYVPLTAYYLLLITYCSPLTTHNFRQQQQWAPAGHTAVRPYQRLAPRLAIFWDWSSLFQKTAGTADGRTTKEKAAFASALHSMQIWYVHQKLCSFLVTDMPPGCMATGYEERGWPTVERAWTMVGSK